LSEKLQSGTNIFEKTGESGVYSALNWEIRVQGRRWWLVWLWVRVEEGKEANFIIAVTFGEGGRGYILHSPRQRHQIDSLIPDRIDQAAEGVVVEVVEGGDQPGIEPVAGLSPQKNVQSPWDFNRKETITLSP